MIAILHSNYLIHNHETIGTKQNERILNVNILIKTEKVEFV